MKKCIFFLSFLFLTFCAAAQSFVDPSSDKTIGNPLHSPHNIQIYTAGYGGASGNTDYLKESALFRYRVRSINRHIFAARLYHLGYTTGIFSNRFTFYHGAIMAGFEYLYKIFAPDSGIFTFFDVGFVNWGFALNAGVGLGDRFRNGFEFKITYFFNNCLFNEIDFYFTIFKWFSLRGKLGADVKFNTREFELFTLYGGIFPGVAIKEYVKIEIGGGFTMDDYTQFRGFGGINLIININF